MRRLPPFVWLLVIIGGIVGILLLTRVDASSALGADGGQLPRVIALVVILFFLLLSLARRGNGRRTLRHATIWGGIVAILLVAYTFRDEISDVARRVAAEVVPGQTEQVADDGTSQVVINRVRGGHFVVTTTLNNARVEMMVDTGASIVTLTPEDARLAGIAVQDLNYTVSVQTANGTARAAQVILDSVAVGPIVRRRVVALVTQEGMLETSLLGLNFLNSLGSYSFSGRQLVLSP